MTLPNLVQTFNLKMMTAKDVFDLLKENTNERGLQNWAKSGVKGMDSFGLGLTQLKKLAKGLPKNQELADELWNTNNWDAKQMACLIGEPKKLSRERLDGMAQQTTHWMLGHTFMQNVVSKSPLLEEVAQDWKESDDAGMRYLGWSGVGYLAKKSKAADAEWQPVIERIESSLQQEENLVKDGMNNALFQIGNRSSDLHKRALAAAKSIGKVEVDYGENSCEALDVVKHLSSPRIMGKFS